MTVTLAVEGMSCDGCERTVEEALTQVERVESVTVDWTSSTATVKEHIDLSAVPGLS